MSLSFFFVQKNNGLFFDYPHLIGDKKDIIWEKKKGHYLGTPCIKFKVRRWMFPESKLKKNILDTVDSPAAAASLSTDLENRKLRTLFILI